MFRIGLIKVLNTNPGRKRINILGEFDFTNFKTITTLTEDKCNKEKIVEFLMKLLKLYPTQNIVLSYIDFTPK